MNPQSPGPRPSVLDPAGMQRALQQSETRLRSVVDSASMVLWALDRDGVFTFSQGKMLEALGLRAGDVVGRSVFDVYAGVPEILADQRRALAGEEFTSVAEVAGIAFECRYSTVRDEAGAVDGVIGVAVDITERRRVEAERERAASLLRATLESTADGILVVDVAGRIASYNQKLADMWELPEAVLEAGDDEAAIAHVLAQLREPERFVAKVQELYRHPERASFDVIEFSDGRVFERYSQPQRLGDQIVGRVWSFRDVTAGRHAEAELRRRERQLGHTQRLAHLGSWNWEVATNTVTWSDELYRIYGLDPSTSPATFAGYLAFVHPEDRERVQAAISSALREGSTFDFIERIIRPDGEIRVLRSQGEVVRDAAGAPARLIGACQDITDRARAEAALRNAEASYRAIFELSNDAIFVHDIETGEIVDANHAACALHGCTLEELKALGVGGISDGDPPYSAAEAGVYLDRASAGEPQLFEWVVRTASGERIWVEVDLRRVAINGVDRLLATVRDVTSRKAAEAVLQRSHEQLEALVAQRTVELADANRALQAEIVERERAEREVSQRTAELEAIFGALPDLYFRLDADHRVLECRSGPDSSLFLPPDDVVGRHLRELLPQEAWPPMEAGIREVGRTRRLVRMEYARHSDDGDHVFEARFLPLLDSQVIVVARDITDRHRAERALRESEEHYRRLIENSSDVATIIGPDGVSRYQSPSILNVLGYRPEDLVGTNSFDRVHPEDVPPAREALASAVRNPGETRSAEFRYRHRDGSWRVLETRVRTLLADSASEGVILNSRDITERKRYEEALERAKGEAELANRAKSEFLSRMSHELRTPMNSILGFAQLLERKPLPDDQRKGVEHILKAGRHLLQLINEVLEIARIESGRQTLSLEPVRLTSVLQESLSLIQPLAAQRGLGIEECTVDPELFVRADRQRLVQVLLNLLSNAVKYNRVGGSVWITCEVVRRDDATTISRIGVHDTGPGIEPGLLERLFVPFERLGAEQSQVEGTGLGLALSLRLVEAMGGTLTVDSTPGEGSTFFVDLVIVDQPGGDASADALGDRASLAHEADVKGTLLYIEDNLPNLALIESILMDRPGVRLLSALQGQIGLDLAWEHHPDLILLDLHLPDLSGEEVLRRLAADERTRDTPVVVVSADATPGTVARLTKAGAAAYLTKPLDVGDFLATLDRCLKGGP